MSSPWPILTPGLPSAAGPWHGRSSRFTSYSMPSRPQARDTYPPPLEFLRHSGGIFLDMAVHDLDLTRFLVGEVEEVQSWGANLLDARLR